MSLSTEKWYALAVVNGREAHIRKTILNRLKRAGMLSADLQFVCPDEEVIIDRGTPEKRTQRRHILPGYMLVQARDLTPGRVNTIVRATGVLGFLGGDEHPTRLPRAEVDKMLGAGSGSGAATTVRAPQWEKDQLVTITDGPLSDFSGTISEVNEARQEATVEVEIFGRKTPTAVAFSALRKG